MNSKKGISGVVSTVLIILIVVAAVAILGAIVINSANKTSSKIEDSTLCQDLVIGPIKCTYFTSNGLTSVTLLLNRKSGGSSAIISNASIIFEDNNGNVITKYLDLTGLPAPLETKALIFNGLTDVPEKASIVSYIKDSRNNEVPCAQSNKIICTDVTAPPGVPPASPSATPQSANQVSLSWTPVNGASSYKVYKLIGAAYNYIGGTQTNSYLDSSNLVGGTTYYYKISANNSLGEGPMSSEIVVTTLPTNYYMSFDGTNDYVSIPNSPSLGMNQNISISAWVNSTRPFLLGNAYGMIVTKSAPASYDVWELRTNTLGSGFQFIANISGYNAYGSYGGPIQINTTWYHIVWTYNGTTAKMYVGGVQSESLVRSGVMALVPAEVRIGGRMENGFTWKGGIDEVRIYNRSLSAGEVSQINAVGRAYSPSIVNSGLVSYYNFDETPTNNISVADKTGSNNGVANNGPFRVE